MNTSLQQSDAEQTPILSVVDETQPLLTKSNSTQPQSCLTDLDLSPLTIYLTELKYLLQSALPIIFAFLIQDIMPLNSVSSLGSIGSIELGAAALSNMFAGITGLSIAIGMSTALDTLCSQSFTGSDDKTILGLHLQRGILINACLFVPIGIVWYNVESIMLLLGQDIRLAKYCGIYLRTLIIGAPAFLTFECLKKFLQAQRIMKAQTLIMIVVVPINLLLNYILVRSPTTTLGFVGAPITVVLTHYITLLLGIIYTVYIDGYQCWRSWSWASLSGWYPYIQLGIPGIFMVCSEWWAFEIISLSASYLGTVPLAAQSVVMSITNAIFSVPFGLSVAVSNRIGNLLGECNAKRSQLSTRAALTLALSLPCISATLLYTFGYQLGQFFTKDAEVLKLIVVIIPIASLYQILDGISTVSTGILRGQGRQKLGAIIYLIAFYIIAIPLGLYLAFILHYGIVGLYIGTFVALTLISPPLVVLNLTTDWDLQVQLCSKRLDSI